MDMRRICISVTDSGNIEMIDGYYRYVDRVHALATTGFRTRAALLRNVDIIRFDDQTIEAMQERYYRILTGRR